MGEESVFLISALFQLCPRVLMLVSERHVFISCNFGSGYETTKKVAASPGRILILKFARQVYIKIGPGDVAN